MDLFAKARQLESTIARTLDRAAREAFASGGAGPCEPLEIVHLVADAIDQEIQPGGRGTRVFPFNSITLSVVAASREARARLEAVLDGERPLKIRILEHLRSQSCAIDDVAMEIIYTSRPAKDWRHPQFNLALARVTATAVSAPAREPAPTRLDLAVLRGTTARKTYAFSARRIDLGRCAEVRDTRHRLLRTNHVAFSERAGEINQSVSRRHAHIAYEPASGGFRVHDDGSVHGTSVVRNGSTIAVPSGSLGVRLMPGDEVVLGDARVRINFDPTV